MNDLTFYNQLRPQKQPLPDVLAGNNFQPVPSSWHIIITDVKASTQAVAAGRHNDVNLAAAGSLIAALNVAKKYKAEIPFFYGGDGSTLLVPDGLLTETLRGLLAHNQNTKQNFGLEMHIGSLSVKELWEAGHSIRIAKWEIDSSFSKAIALGDGLRYAEQQIKQAMKEEEYEGVTTEDLNLTGLECRWNKISPPVAEAYNICYLIETIDPDKQAAIYTDVLKKMEAVYGDAQMRNPLSPERLQGMLNLRNVKREMLARFGKWRLGHFLKAALEAVVGNYYLKHNWRIRGQSGDEYLQQLIAHADTLTVDGRINTIVCASSNKHNEFLQYLSHQEASGLLIFGHHVSKESVMTCYIEDRRDKHIHFVDGADGGYTEAAKEFKAKLQKL